MQSIYISTNKLTFKFKDPINPGSLSVCPSGTPINKPPVLGYKDLNLFKLFRLVFQLGGCHKVSHPGLSVRAVSLSCLSV